MQPQIDVDGQRWEVTLAAPEQNSAGMSCTVIFWLLDSEELTVVSEVRAVNSVQELTREELEDAFHRGVRVRGSATGR